MWWFKVQGMIADACFDLMKLLHWRLLGSFHDQWVLVKPFEDNYMHGNISYGNTSYSRYISGCCPFFWGQQTSSPLNETFTGQEIFNIWIFIYSIQYPILKKITSFFQLFLSTLPTSPGQPFTCRKISSKWLGRMYPCRPLWRWVVRSSRYICLQVHNLSHSIEIIKVPMKCSLVRVLTSNPIWFAHMY